MIQNLIKLNRIILINIFKNDDENDDDFIKIYIVCQKNIFNRFFNF